MPTYCYSFKVIDGDLKDTIYHRLYISDLAGKIIFDEPGLFNYEEDLFNLKDLSAKKSQPWYAQQETAQVQ